MTTRGKFITFEGIDGAGKSSHVGWAVQQLRQRGHQVRQTREPGGTPLGEKLRELVLHDAMTPATEALLVFAARQEHVLTVIEPALAQGEWVVSDRYTDATLAYQGYGRGFALAPLLALKQWVQPQVQPDLTLVFDCDEGVAAQRLATARAADRFEQQSAEFFGRVRRGYLELARAEPGRFVVIASDRPLAEVQAAVAAALDHQALR